MARGRGGGGGELSIYLPSYLMGQEGGKGGGLGLSVGRAARVDGARERKRRTRWFARSLTGRISPVGFLASC